MMELLLRRKPSLAHCTLGELYVDGAFACHTLEDVVREVPGQPVEQWKIPGETAIPAGSYAVAITRSQRFGRDLPLLIGVPGFTGVRIHSGNTAKDTEGCILVGTRVAGAAIVESRQAYAALFVRLRQALDNGEQVWLNIRNPEIPAAVKPAAEEATA